MVHVSRLGALFTAMLGTLAWGCGSEDPESAPEAASPDETGESDGTRNVPPFSPEGAFSVSLPEQSIAMRARAELLVNQGEPDVRLSITGLTGGTDVLLIDTTFDGVQNALGEHHAEFQLPTDDGAPHQANAMLGGTWYYSQSGDIHVNLSNGGKLEGSFEIALAQGELVDPNQPVAFVPSERPTRLVGSLNVPWTLSCHSRLPGHETLLFGGRYCEELQNVLQAPFSP